MSVVKVTCFADNAIAVGKDGRRIESHPNEVETLPDDSPEAQAILNPPPRPDPGLTLEDRIAILETAAKLPGGIPVAYATASDAAAVVKEAAPEQITKPLQVKP